MPTGAHVHRVEAVCERIVGGGAHRGGGAGLHQHRGHAAQTVSPPQLAVWSPAAATTRLQVSIQTSTACLITDVETKLLN